MEFRDVSVTSKNHRWSSIDLLDLDRGVALIPVVAVLKLRQPHLDRNWTDDPAGAVAMLSPASLSQRGTEMAIPSAVP